MGDEKETAELIQVGSKAVKERQKGKQVDTLIKLEAGESAV